MRGINWLAIMAIAMATIAILLAVFGYRDISLALAITSIPISVLAAADTLTPPTQ